MLTSSLHLVRQLTDLLLRVAPLLQQFERKSPQALPGLLGWIGEAEDLLGTHRLPHAAEIAGLKACILAPAFDDAQRGTLRRRQQAIAVGQLHALQDTLQQALRPRALRIEQARDLARQLLQAVAGSGAIAYDPAVPLDRMVDAIWALCTRHDQLKPYAAQLKVLLSNDDIRLLLAEEIDPADFAAP